MELTLLITHSHIQPSHQKNEFDYLMPNVLEWTELAGGNSFHMTKIADLPRSQGNFHSYNKRVIYKTIIKNVQGGYRYKMGIQCYRLQKNVDYTLCIEILNTDYQLWHKARISVDKTTSQGLTIENVLVGKFSQRYLDSKTNPEFMYYHLVIINLKKTESSVPYVLHLLVDIKQVMI